MAYMDAFGVLFAKAIQGTEYLKFFFAEFFCGWNHSVWEVIKKAAPRRSVI